MKKIITLSMAIIALSFYALSASAQEPASFYYDFEDDGVDISRFRAPGWTNNLVGRVANPLTEDPINSSAFVLSVQNPNLQSNSGFVMMDLNQQTQVTDVSTFNRLQFKIYRNGLTNSQVAIQYDGSGDEFSPVEPLTADEGWQVVEFEISPRNYNAHALRLFFNSSTTTDEIFIDDINYYEATATNIESVDVKSDVSIYSNSSSGAAELVVSMVNDDNLDVSVYSITGQLVKCLANGYYASGDYRIPLNISESGLYIFSVTIGKEKTQIKHLVK